MRPSFMTIVVLGCLACNVSVAQQTVAIDSATKSEVRAIYERVDNRFFRFGMSVGVRTGLKWEESSRAVPYITPDSNVVGVEHLDMMALIISTSLTVFPFESPKWKWLGFTANINFVELSDRPENASFNKTIDGGMGFAIAVDKDQRFCIGLTYERTSIRRPTNYVLDLEGEQIIQDGDVLTSLDPSDPRFFIDSGLNAISLKFIYHFN